MITRSLVYALSANIPQNVFCGTLIPPEHLHASQGEKKKSFLNQIALENAGLKIDEVVCFTEGHLIAFNKQHINV